MYFWHFLSFFAYILSHNEYEHKMLFAIIKVPYNTKGGNIMKGKWKLSPQRALVFALLFTLLCTILSSAILHDWGKIKIETTTLTTQAGDKVVARIFKPDTATAENPAPAVIFTHGLTVNKESYSQYGLELARRGFVVILPDMLNHGDSDVTGMETYLGPYFVNDAYGAYAAVRYAKTLDYVDQSQIGVAGHSAGGQASNNCIRLDDQEAAPAISAIYLVSSDPVFTDENGAWINFYGTRDLGIYYTLYDHVYFKGLDPNGAPMGVQDWLSSESAKSLFAFGQSPENFNGDSVVPGHTYFSEIDGDQSFRRVNAAKEIHPKPQGGSNALAAVCDFFQDTFEAPNYIVGQNQKYAALTTFNLLGLLGVLLSCVAAVGCLTRTKLFSSVQEGENAVLRPAPDKKGKVWFWVLTVLNCVFAFISISIIFRLGFGYCNSPIWAQQPSNIYALWALCNGLFMLLTSFGSYALYARKAGATMSNWGLKVSFKNFLKSILVALISCFVVFGIVAISNRLFSVDYHYYLWGLKNIPLENIGVFFAYLPMYLIFGLAVSIALNSAYHCKIANEPEWVNDLFFAFMNTLPHCSLPLWAITCMQRMV